MMLLLRQSPLGPLVPLRRSAPRGATRIKAPKPVAWHFSLPEAWVGRVTRGLLVLGMLFLSYQATLHASIQLSPPISRVQLLADSEHISRSSVEQQLQIPADATYFTVDLQAIRARLLQLPWVADAEVRRVWPDEIEVRLKGQLPLARWGEQELLNASGERFRPADGLDTLADLPQLVGPDGQERDLMQNYRLLARLLRPTGLQISRLELRERGSWFLDTRQGIQLMLGRDHVPEKMQRLVQAWPAALQPHVGDITRIDLRYSNGLAIAWRAGRKPAN